MRLSELIADLPVTPLPPPSGPDGLAPTPAAPDPEVEGVAHDSRRVEPGDLFVAWRGARFDGAEYAPQAVERGAVAVVSSPRPAAATTATTAASPSAPARPPVPWLTTADPHALLGPLAVRVYRHPHRDLLLAGVTGTNGKSTVVALLASILEAAGRPAGVLGTLGYRFRDAVDESGRTTPEASDLFRILRAMCEAGAAAAVMEVSSHALALGRVGEARFDLAVFTNLSRDHFDFHPDLEHYYATKRSLFDLLEDDGAAAVNVDDEWGRRLAGELAGAGIRRVTFGADGDVRVVAADLGVAETHATVATPLGEVAFTSPLLGRFNLSNSLAAVAGAVALELPPEAIAAGLAAQPRLPGRLEPIDSGPGFTVYIDYAHTPAALRAALDALSELAPGERIVVFGCGGDRDRGKRAIMGEIAGELADRPILTSDNPRTEDPQAILDEVEVGLRASGNRDYQVVADRREAIRRAVEIARDARAGSSVLIAGKGHETFQMVGDERRPFSDRDEIARALADDDADTHTRTQADDGRRSGRPAGESPGALDRG